MDEDTGLYFYGSRYYDPELARFVQADTVVPSATTSQALNRYSYVINNPLRLTDPTGHGFRDFLQKTLGKHYGDVMIAAGQMLIASGLGGIYGFVVGTIMIAAGTAYNVFIIQRGSFGDFAMQFGVNWGSALIGKCVGEGLGLQTSIEGGDIIGAAISGAIVGSISGVFCSDVYGQNAWRGAYRGAAWGAGMAGGFAAFNAIANGGGGNVTNELVGPPETPTVNIEELSGIANSWLFEGCGCQEITLSWSPAGKFGPSRVIYFGAGGKLVEGGSITDISAYGSFEAHFVGGVGMGAVTCIDENGVLNIFYYHKLCIGGTIMGGGGGGLVRGLNGINCRPNNYSRWFYEIGGGVGVGSVGFDIGYDSSNWGLPGSFTGVFEGGGGIGPPGPTKIGFKSSWCYYFIDEVQKFPSN